MAGHVRDVRVLQETPADRLHLTPDGRVRYDLRRPFSDGTHAVVFAPYEFIEKLCALIPPPRANLVTYHGVLAPAHTWRARIVQTISDRSALPRRRPATTDDDTTDATERIRRHTWAELMRRVFDLDVLECPHCKGRRRLIALITDPPVIRAILDALGIQPAPRAPPPFEFALN